jgi:hypothetical protein
MQRRIARLGGLVLGVGLMLTVTPAQGVITRLTPLRDVLEQAHFILVVKVDALDADKPAVVLAADVDLKGKAPFRRLPVNLTGDSEAVKHKQTPQLLKRLAPGQPLLLFVNQGEDKKSFIALAYTNGTWFQLTGTPGDEPSTVRWAFTHLEPYLRRTYKGTTAELKQVVLDVLAGKKEPPQPDSKEKPGLGPEVEDTKERGGRSVAREQVFALHAPPTTVPLSPSSRACW